MRILLLFLFGITITPLFAQSGTPSPIAQLIADAKSKGETFRTIEPFISKALPDHSLRNIAADIELLRLDAEKMQDWWISRPSTMTLLVPFGGEVLELELVRRTIETEDFSVITNLSNGKPVRYEKSLYYHGIVKREGGSLAAISMSPFGIMGVISTPTRGNINLGKSAKTNNSTDYYIFSESKLTIPNPNECHTAEVSMPMPHIQLEDRGGTSNCVRIFWEADYALFLEKGSVAATVAYLEGAFSIMKLLYDNESVSTQLSQLFIWVTQDPYPLGGGNSQLLSYFSGYRTTFNGDLAHLVSRSSLTSGGIAYLPGLCTTDNHAFSKIHTSYNGTLPPVYSWTIEVLTHETGHNLGSAHTQNCGWSGGAIDNCYATEGGCAQGPAPTNGGTIMSYCHLASYGINFSNGFGPLPGNAIRSTVANCTSLSPTCTSPSGCGYPNNISVSTTMLSTTISWGAISGAVSYDLQYRAINGSTWTTANITAPTTSYTINPTQELINMEVALRTNCASGSSNYTDGVLFLSGPDVCAKPTQPSVTNITGNSAQINFTDNNNPDVTSWDYYVTTSSTPPTAGTSPTHPNVSSYVITGLIEATEYYAYIRTNCTSPIAESAWSDRISFSTRLDCENSPILTLGTNQSFTLGTGNGAWTFPGDNPPNNTCGFSTPGKEIVYRFTPTTKGMYILELVSHSGSWVDFFWKPASDGCSDTGWTGVDDLDDPTQLGIGPLQAGVTYYILADCEENDKTTNTTFQINRNLTIPNPNDNTCSNYSVIGGNGGFNERDGAWRLLKSGSNTVGMLQTTQNLGAVTINMADYNTVPTVNSVKYLPRYTNISSTTAPSTNVGVVLFYRNDELSAFNAAPTPTTTTIDDLKVSFYNGVNENCTPADNSGGTVGLITPSMAFPWGSNEFGLYYTTTHFTEFAASLSAVLPLDLLSFDGKALDRHNELHWETTREYHIHQHILQRSEQPGQQDWQTIATIAPQPASIQQNAKYSYEDRQPLAEAYYRLLFEDNDGTATYSPIVHLVRDDYRNSIVKIYPTPSNDRCTLQYHQDGEREISVAIYDLSGREIYRQTFTAQKGLNNANLDISALVGGVYLVRLHTSNQASVPIKLVKM